MKHMHAYEIETHEMSLNTKANNINNFCIKILFLMILNLNIIMIK